jgi:hypothetical protein
MVKNRARIKRELPRVGTVLKGRFKGIPYTGKIVKDENMATGKAIRYNNNNYPSMTAAAKVITKQSINGWRFWKF